MKVQHKGTNYNLWLGASGPKKVEVQNALSVIANLHQDYTTKERILLHCFIESDKL
jgi:hypothetical protein